MFIYNYCGGGEERPMASMELLKQRSIIDILIGDKEMNVKDEQVTLSEWSKFM